VRRFKVCQCRREQRSVSIFGYRKPDFWRRLDIAERFSKLGDPERTEKILGDEVPQATAFSTKDWPGYARGTFAQSLARFDPDTALKRVAEADSEDR